MDPIDARYGGLLTLWPAIFPTEAGQNVSPKKRPRSSTPRPKTVGSLPSFATTPDIVITTSWTASSFCLPTVTSDADHDVTSYLSDRKSRDSRL